MEWIIVSRHAADRWHQRTDSPGVGPIVAWNRAERRDVRDLNGDEIRYHRASETLLVRKGRVLVTVVDAPTARRQIRQDVYGQRGEPVA